MRRARGWPMGDGLRGVGAAGDAVDVRARLFCRSSSSQRFKISDLSLFTTSECNWIMTFGPGHSVDKLSERFLAASRHRKEGPVFVPGSSRGSRIMEMKDQGF